MIRWHPCKRRDFIRKLAALELKVLLREVEQLVSQKISLKEWERL